MPPLLIEGSMESDKSKRAPPPKIEWPAFDSIDGSSANQYLQLTASHPDFRILHHYGTEDCPVEIRHQGRDVYSNWSGPTHVCTRSNCSWHISSNKKSKRSWTKGRLVLCSEVTSKTTLLVKKKREVCSGLPPSAVPVNEVSTMLVIFVIVLLFWLVGTSSWC